MLSDDLMMLSNTTRVTSVSKVAQKYASLGFNYRSERKATTAMSPQ